MSITYVPRAFGSTIILSTPPALTAVQLAQLVHYVPPVIFAGTTMPLFPITPPVYQANGVILQDVPTVMTAPAVQGKLIAAGSVFTLLFSNPSAGTQSALANGLVVTLTFALYGGGMATGSVLCASSLTSGMFQVQCTTLVTISIT
jgi:hypothetical protein